jgi:hypothetical protein
MLECQVLHRHFFPKLTVSVRHRHSGIRVSPVPLVTYQSCITQLCCMPIPSSPWHSFHLYFPYLHPRTNFMAFTFGSTVPVLCKPHVIFRKTANCWTASYPSIYAFLNATRITFADEDLTTTSPFLYLNVSSLCVACRGWGRRRHQTQRGLCLPSSPLCFSLTNHYTHTVYRVY